MMKHFLWLLVAAAMITFTSCDKNKGGNSKQQADVSFATTGDFEKSMGGKDTKGFEKDGVQNCEEYDASYLYVMIDGEEYRLPITIIGDMLTSQTIKLDVGTHTVEEFIVMNDAGTAGIYDDDIIVYSAVHAGAEFADLVSTTLTHDINVSAFQKNEVHLEVVCYSPEDYDYFGFEYFTLWVTTIREKCFFGDVCVPCLDDYEGSAYQWQSGGIQADMPAIAQIEVYRNGDLTGTYSNEEWYAEGEPLCVPYADRDDYTDEFEFRLSVLLPVGDDFEYVYQYSWYCVDDETAEDADGITEYVLGNCLYDTEGVVVLPYHVDLPATTDFMLDETSGPGSLGSYFDIDIDAPEGYYLTDGLYAGWCAEQTVFITLGQWYSADVYSSLDPAAAAAATSFTETEIKVLHWLINNLDSYGYSLNSLSGDDWETIQNVIWSVTDGLGLTDPTEQTIAADANANYSNYAPFAGQDEKFLVVLYTDDNTQLQIMDLPLCE